MRVNEVRTNSVVTKSNTKANYANKQAFSALPYISKTTSRVFSVIGKKIYDFGTMIKKQYNRIPIVREHKEKLAKSKKLIALLADLHTKGLAHEDMIKGPPTEFAKAVRKILEKKKITPPNKQAFYALPYISKTTGRAFSVGRAILDAEDFLINLNPVAVIRKAIAKANYKSPEDIRIENLVKKYRLEREIKQQNQVIEDYKKQMIIPRENQLKEVIQNISDLSAK